MVIAAQNIEVVTYRPFDVCARAAAIHTFCGTKGQQLLGQRITPVQRYVSNLCSCSKYDTSARNLG